MALLCIYKVMTFRVPHCRTTAFTLIEVVMAMAVVSFALLAITGLLPVGLQTMRDSQNDQALGTIANQVRGDLPVSYTHLDVYKRQAEEPVDGISGERARRLVHEDYFRVDPEHARDGNELPVRNAQRIERQRGIDVEANVLEQRLDRVVQRLSLIHI